MENPVLDKNLECIGRYNPKLKEELENLPSLTQQFDLIENELKESILTYNGAPLHSLQGAEEEAKKIFEATTNNKVSIHIVFGMGLGYLFKEFCEGSKGEVILYEPNLEILRVTLELVDFSKELSKKNIKIASDLESFKRIFANSYSYNATPLFTTLDSYKELYKDELNEIIKQIELIAGSCLVEYNTTKLFIVDSAKMMVENLPFTLNEMPLYKFKNAFRDKTALIVAAGPSLDLNIETIKKYRDKVVIFCVGTAMKSLAKNGITPDFLNVIEVNDCSGQVEGIDLSEVNIILEPYTHNTFHKLKSKRKFLFPANSAHANNAWAKLTNVDISAYSTKGTVSYEAVESAKILGFSKIILVGQDLAFINNQCYSKDSAYSELTYDINPDSKKVEFKVNDIDKYIDSLLPIPSAGKQQGFENFFANHKVENLNQTLLYVKGVTGEMLPTQSNYATFINHFKSFASENKDLDLINSSMVGAQIDGFKNISLEKALEGVLPIQQMPDLDEKLFLYDKKSILRNIGEEELLLKNLIKEFEKAQEYIYKYDREYIRHKTATEETMKYFKLLLSLYLQINTDYKTKSSLYAMICFNEDIEIEFLLKLNENASIEYILAFYERLKRYYSLSGQKLVEIIKILEQLKEIMIESIDSES